MKITKEVFDTLVGTKKAYQVSELKGASHIKYEVFYSKGGMNWFTSSSERRGYYLAVQFVDMEEREFSDGTKYTTESMSLFKSKKYFISNYEIQRKSAKAEREAMDNLSEDLINQLLLKIEGEM